MFPDDLSRQGADCRGPDCSAEVQCHWGDHAAFKSELQLGRHVLELRSTWLQIPDQRRHQRLVCRLFLFFWIRFFFFQNEVKEKLRLSIWKQSMVFVSRVLLAGSPCTLLEGKDPNASVSARPVIHICRIPLGLAFICLSNKTPSLWDQAKNVTPDLLAAQNNHCLKQGEKPCGALLKISA